MGMSVERGQQLQPSTRRSYAAPYSRASSDNTRKTMTNLMKAPHEQSRKDRRSPSSQRREEDLQRKGTKNQKKPQSCRPPNVEYQNAQSNSHMCTVYNTRGATNDTLDATSNQFKQYTNLRKVTEKLIRRSVISTKPIKRTTTRSTTAPCKHTSQKMNSESDSDAPLCRGQSAQTPPGITEMNEIQIFVRIDCKQKPITVSPHSTIRAAKEQLRNKHRWTYAGKVMQDDKTINH